MISLNFDLQDPADAIALVELYEMLSGRYSHRHPPVSLAEVPSRPLADIIADEDPERPLADVIAEEEMEAAHVTPGPAQTERKARKPRSDKGASRTKTAATQEAPNAAGTSSPVQEGAPALAAAPKEADVIVALKTLFDVKGFQAAMDVLERHGVKRAGELDPKQYLAFIAECVAGSAA